MIEILTDIKLLGTLKGKWNRLPELKGNPLITYEWFLACVNVLHSEESICVVVVQFNSRVNAIAPLVRVRQNNVERLRLMGVNTLGEPSDLLFDDQNFLQSLLCAIRDLKRPILLQRISADSPIGESLKKDKFYDSIIIKRNATSSVGIFIGFKKEHYEEYLSP